MLLQFKEQVLLLMPGWQRERKAASRAEATGEEDRGICTGEPFRME